MGVETGIEWTDSTWNPIRGCTRVSEGCRNCYAEQVAARFSGPGMPYEGLAGFRVHTSNPDEITGDEELRSFWTGEVRVVDEHLNDPLRWQRPRKIFVNSMSDLFHEKVSDETILRVFDVFRECANGFSTRLNRRAAPHVFQVLTKRPERMRDFCKRLRFDQSAGEIGGLFLAAPGEGGRAVVLPRVWLGVSVENQQAADTRITILVDTPAAVRFLSCEPLIDEVSIDGWLANEQIDWVIVGGESGARARPMREKWATRLINECAAHNVPLFFKQWGEHDERGVRVGKRAAGAMIGGVEHKEFPQ